MGDSEFERCIAKIEAQGYCRLRGVFDHTEVSKALALTKKHYQQSKDMLADDLPALAGHDPFVWNLQSKDHYFLELLFASSLAHAVLRYFLNDRWYKQIPQSDPNYILRSFLARSSDLMLPMHIDSLVPYKGNEVFVMQMAICLEPQTVENGCTRFVNGSHLSGEYVEQSAFEIAEPLELNPGDIALWDSRVWHGAGENHTQVTRWALIATFTRWWLKQMFDITGTLPRTIYDKLTDPQRAVLGFCSIPHRDESVGVDMKRGYDALT